MAHLPAPLILASTSPYRRELLARLGLPFTQEASGVEEAPLPGEAPEALVSRLALAKAAAVAARHPEAIVIGSDQMALVDGEVLGKPGTPALAQAQLRRLSGQRVRFLTALAVQCPQQGALQVTVPYEVQMRTLSEAEIADYVARDNPVDAAGSFKSEGLGIALFAGMYGDDPSALVGLPLIHLTALLSRCGCRVLG